MSVSLAIAWDFLWRGVLVAICVFILLMAISVLAVSLWGEVETHGK